MEKLLRNIMFTPAIRLNMSQRTVIYYGTVLIEKDGYLCTETKRGNKVIIKKIMRVGESINMRSPYAQALREKYYEVLGRED